MATALSQGTSYSWPNITVIGLGTPFLTVTKIEYKVMQEKTNNYGPGAEPISRGYGRVEYEGSIEMYLDEWRRIVEVSPNRNPLQIAPFDITIILAGAGVAAATEVLRSVEFLESPMVANEGDTRLLVTIPIIIGTIER
jgi:hypothetical protein